jgi:DNA-binding GntR family transcriptional regulator
MVRIERRQAQGGTMPIPKRTRRRRERAGVHEDVLATLRQAIVSGVLLPGETLVVDELEEWLAVSSTPIREALTVLAGEGLVVRRANRPAVVAPLTKQGALDLVRVYGVLADTAYRWGAPHLTEIDIREMRAAGRELAESIEASDLDGAAEATMRLHVVLIRRAGSVHLTQLLVSYLSRVHRLIRLQYPDAYAPSSIALHEAIIDAFENGDTDLALARLDDAWQGLARGVEAIPDDDWDPDEAFEDAALPF